MDTTVDPCQDFFQYACGGWIAKNPIPANKPVWSTVDVMVQQASTAILDILKASNDPNNTLPVNQARDFYASCTNTTLLETIGLRPLTKFLSSFGGWPMTLKYWNPKAFSWQKAIATMTRLYKQGILLSVYNRLDEKNSSRSDIHIDRAKTLLPSDDRRGEYTAFITGAAQSIRDALKSPATNGQIVTDVADMLKFESALTNIKTLKDRKLMSVTELQNWTDGVNTTATYGKVNWLKLLNDIYQVGAGISITKSEEIVVLDAEYLKELVNVLNKTPMRTIANYVHWSIVNRLATTTNQKMKDLKFKYEGITDPIPLDETCAETAGELLGFAVSYQYVASHFDKAAKRNSLTMVNNLITAFKLLVDNATWIDSATKEIAKDKADYIVANIGYPDWMINKTALQTYYSALSISRSDYFASYQSASALFNAKHLKKLREPLDRTSWQLTDSYPLFPHGIDAMYDPSYNAITFPAAMLQFPLYNRDLLAALNYGGIGGIIGHEITHAFSDEGGKYDKYGNKSDWWSNTTLANYLKRAQCFIDQYGNYSISDGTHLNGTKTQGENMADSGGLREAFQAYKLYVTANGVEPKLPGFETFTSEKLFYLSYAHPMCGMETPERLKTIITRPYYPHSPFKFRVNGPVSNDDNFSSLFNCPVGSPMNPKSKCILW